MTNDKHAPGRGWKAVQTSSGWHVSEDGYGMIFRVLPQNRGVDEVERLMGIIAAAPELLAALEPMCDPPCGPPMRTGPLAGTVPVYLTQAQIDAMRSALAKARGVS